MIRISQIKCVPEKVTRNDGSMDTELLKRKAAKIMGIVPQRIERLYIRRRSIDARKKPQIFYIFSVDVTLKGIADEQFLKQKQLRGCEKSPYTEYMFPDEGTERMRERPLIAGFGPAGLFCAYELALHGYRPIVIERGKSVEERTGDVERFFREGALLPDSNVQFGEGGAGAFSDGKLNTLIHDPAGRSGEALRILCEHGAKEEICYDAKPHLGTDALGKIVKNIRQKIISLGGEVLFETKLIGFKETGGYIAGADVIETAGGKERRTIPCGALVLALGHSARDTLEMLYEKHIAMEAKSFAVGLRTEHAQTFINESQYGRTDAGVLGAAAYKLTAKAKSGRGVYTFCMCPGGYVVNASSEEGMLAVNGMSYSRRDGENANSAVIVTVDPKDYGDGHPLSGVAFQRDLEKKAYALAGGKVPVERYGQFKAEVCASGCAAAENVRLDRQRAESVQADNACADARSDRKLPLSPCIKGQYAYAKVSEILPIELARDFVEGMEAFDRKIPGFAADDVLLEGIESRTSSPVRILRGKELTSLTVKNLYPCGEGAGYAGGIMSAAMDGIRVAEAVAARYRKP